MRWARPNLTSLPKVGNLDNPRAVAQQILGLKVAMEEAPRVHEMDALQQLQHDRLDGCGLEVVHRWDSFLDHLKNVAGQMLEYHVESLFGVPEHLDQLDNIGMRRFPLGRVNM